MSDTFNHELQAIETNIENNYGAGIGGPSFSTILYHYESIKCIGIIIRETKRAYLINLENHKAFIPKSQIREIHKNNKIIYIKGSKLENKLNHLRGEIFFTIPRWLYEKITERK